MTLQRRLLWLLIAFAGFALLATFTTIYAVRVHVEDAIATLQRNRSETEWIEQLRLSAREEHIRLHEVVAGLREPDALYLAQRDAFLNELRQVARFTLRRDQGPAAEQMLELTGQLREAFAACLEHVRQAQPEPARQLLHGRIEHQLMPALNVRLQNVRRMLTESGATSVNVLVATNVQVLFLSLAVAVVGVALVAVGVALIRRWVLLPVRDLDAATREFSQGNLGHRLAAPGRDELGALGRAMNEMAENLTRTQSHLRASEAKYRSLFNNLPDAIIICDAQARIIDYQDGDTSLLGRLGRDFTGRSLLDLWGTARADAIDWPTLIGQALTKGARVRVSDIRLRLGGEPETVAIVDLLGFPVSLESQSLVAIVLRDVTAQRRSEFQLRRAEAMEATVTLARGVAHDFSALLTSVITQLSTLSAELGNAQHGELARRALRTCGQAVSLARTLLTFAGGRRGTPEMLNLRETVALILESLDGTWLENVTVQTEFDGDVAAFVDRDQFTEIVLNLVSNASEAMPAGGRLRIKIEAGKLATAADASGPPTHAILVVSDTGPGISPEVRERLFEPFFTTKERGPQRSRGMGLAVVYAAVKNAGGVVQADSRPGAGATFKVWLPLAEPDETDVTRAPAL